MLRFFSFLILIVFCISCDYISPSKKEKQPLGTIIDFTKVDTPPVLYDCKDLIEKEKEKCFEETIQKVFNEAFSKISINENDTVNNRLTIKLTFSKKKELFFGFEKNINIFASDNQTYRNTVEKVVKELKYMYPATKQGIPVTTVYKLPIEIIYSD